ncbi:MAG: low temperature requirement protein A [Marmoricola sp.]
MRHPPLRARSDRQDVVAGSVTTLELFFDLVFVFTITQLTATLGQDHGWAGVGRTVLLLCLMWWMYGGYAWLTNAAPPVTTFRRGCLLLGMVGNFVMALAIPHAFSTDRLVFALGYLLVASVHSGMYLTQSARVTAGMVVQLIVANGVAAVLIVLGGFLGGTATYVCWVVALLAETSLPRLALLTPLRRLDAGPAFVLQPAHFVERHGLMLIIVLGESVLAIGVGVSGGLQTIGIAQIGFAAISLALAACLYWAYFGTAEDHAAEQAMEGATPQQRPWIAVAAYAYSFTLMLLGVVFAASGLHNALAHPSHAIDVSWASQLAGGVAAFWVGLAGFRLAIGRPGAVVRLAGGLLLVATIVLGTQVSGLVQLVALLAGSLVILLVERTTVPGEA